MTSNRHTHTHTHPFSLFHYLCLWFIKNLKKNPAGQLLPDTCCWHFLHNCLLQRGANLWIMNTDLLGSVPALLPTGRPWRHARQRPSADCSLISRLHSAALHSHSSRTLLRLLPASREDTETTIMLMTGLWVNWATLRNENPTDNCTWPLTCYDK